MKGTEKARLNDRGHSLETSASVSAPEQQLDLTYKIPLLKNPLEQYYLLQGGLKNVDLNDTKSVTSKVVASRNWDLSSGWQRAINLTWRWDNFTQVMSATPPCCCIPASASAAPVRAAV